MLVICLVFILVFGGVMLLLMKYFGLYDSSDREGMVSSAMSAIAYDGLGFINLLLCVCVVCVWVFVDGYLIWYFFIVFCVKVRLFEWWDDLENNFMISTFGGAFAYGAWSFVNTSDVGGSVDVYEMMLVNGEEYRDVELIFIGDDDEKDLENLRAVGSSSDDA